MLRAVSVRGQWMAVRRIKWFPIKELQDEAEFVERVGNLMEEAGYRLTPLARSSVAPAFDFLATDPQGRRVAVECKGRGFNTEAELANWVSRGRRVRPALNALWIISDRIHPRLRAAAEAYPDVELWTSFEIYRHMRWIRERQPKGTKQPSKIIRTVKANRGEVVIAAAAALAAMIEEKLQTLREQHPNDPGTIAALDSQISEYEALKAKVEELQAAVAKFETHEIKDSTLEKRALSFGDGVRSWWKKDHAQILSTTAGMGVYVAAVGLCSLIGVSPDVAAGAVAVVMRGKSAIGRKKAARKRR